MCTVRQLPGEGAPSLRHYFYGSPTKTPFSEGSENAIDVLGLSDQTRCPSDLLLPLQGKTTSGEAQTELGLHHLVLCLSMQRARTARLAQDCHRRKEVVRKLPRKSCKQRRRRTGTWLCHLSQFEVCWMVPEGRRALCGQGRAAWCLLVPRGPAALHQRVGV